MVPRESGEGSFQAWKRAGVSSVTDHAWWRYSHFSAFMTGGILFLIGTLLYYKSIGATPSEVSTQGWVTAWLYVVGSCGFLYVDVQEFFTFTADASLRLNIFWSVIGSISYVVGSAGFLPPIYNATTVVGEGGFIIGSFAIFTSQAWKLHRIFSHAGSGSDLKNTRTAACVEGGAALHPLAVHRGSAALCCARLCF